MTSCVYLVLVLTIMRCYSAAPSIDDKESDNSQAIAHASFHNLCNALCQYACPPECVQAPIGPWSRKGTRLRKKAFSRSESFNGLTFDDYGWFMKLLGRNVKG